MPLGALEQERVERLGPGCRVNGRARGQHAVQLEDAGGHVLRQPEHRPPQRLCAEESEQAALAVPVARELAEQAQRVGALVADLLVPPCDLFPGQVIAGGAYGRFPHLERRPPRADEVVDARTRPGRRGRDKPRELTPPVRVGSALHLAGSYCLHRP